MLGKSLMLLLAAPLVFLASCESTSSYETASDTGDYDIRFGVMTQLSSGQFMVLEETTSIDKIVGGGYLHGFAVQKKGGGQFLMNYSVRFPEPLADFPDLLLERGSLSEGGRVYTSFAKMRWDYASEVFGFSESDPLGGYEMSIYVDSELLRLVKYTVAEPLF